MEIVESNDNGVITLQVNGRMDASSSPALERRVLELVDGGERRLVLNLAQLDYISSAGLRVLLVAAKRLSAGGGKLAIAGLQPQVKEVFDVAGFSSILKIFGDAESAVAAVRS